MTPSTNAAFTLRGKGVLDGFLSGEGQQEAQKIQEGDAEWISIDKIIPAPYQPRQYFSEKSIERLAHTFKEQGFRGALNVRRRNDDAFEIVAGERRWRAAKAAGLNKVRCLIDHYTDEEALEFALIENLQREDLSKLEETEGILQLIEAKCGIARDRAIAVIRSEGHSDQQARSDVAPSNELQQIEVLLSLLNIELQTFRTKHLPTLTLPEDLKEAHLKRGLSYSSALELNKIKEKDARLALLREALSQKLSFRDIKKRLQESTKGVKKRSNLGAERSLFARLEVSLKRAKKVNNLLQHTAHKKRFEQIVKDLEALLTESERKETST
ncbi:ParB/RepB/Spo0J family partition protein [Leptolyngbya sp. PL-A3]|uniref:ParB/RepB/Spo0J family partition protein n=1 Tax=Leptolyngbya sp. PL-A3 TaxID=2933911 RepID=UPI003297AA4C